MRNVTISILDFNSFQLNRYAVNRRNISDVHRHAARRITVALTHKEDYALAGRRAAGIHYS